MHEGPHLVVVLDPYGRLDPARNVDSIGLELAQEFAHVSRFKTTGDEYLPSYQQLARDIPIPGLSGAAALVERPGIEHDRVGPRAGVGDLALPDLRGVLVDEDPYDLRPHGQGVDDRLGLLGADVPIGRAEMEPEQVGARFHRRLGGVKVADSADLHPDHFFFSTRRLTRAGMRLGQAPA